MPERNRRRVRRALEAAAEALEFAAGQAETGNWRWVAISTCMGLQGALVAALSGYETADEAAVAHPEAGEAQRVANIPTLLRRAASPDFLDDPERLSGQTGAKRKALALVELRNRAVHLSLDGAPADMRAVPDCLDGGLALIAHLILEHPAFSAEDGTHYCHRIDRALDRLSKAIC